MDKNSNGDYAIDMNCYCKSKHCSGNIYIQPDMIKEERVFMITAIDTSGNDEGSLWLSPEQMKKLAKEISFLVKEYSKEKKNE